MLTRPAPITFDSTVVINPQQVFSDLGGETVILNLEDGVYYGLNSVGARIWNLVQQPRRVPEILALLLDEFDVDAEQCKDDLMAVLEDLRAKELVLLIN